MRMAEPLPGVVWRGIANGAAEEMDCDFLFDMCEKLMLRNRESLQVPSSNCEFQAVCGREVSGRKK